MGKKWLITGGCGFIGTNLVKQLVEDGGHFIRVIDNLSVGKREDLAIVCTFKEQNQFSDSFNSQTLVSKTNSSKSSMVKLIVGDILDFDLAKKAAEGVDVIVHLAANAGVVQSVENPKQDMEVNVIGTLNMLEAARQNNVKRFIFASSGAPIGECQPPIHEDLAPHPVSPYGASKLAGEGYCSAYYRTFAIETVILRFSNVYGPGSIHKNSVVSNFIKKSLKGETLEIFGNGKQTRDFIFIKDLIKAIKCAAKASEIGGEIFQIATGCEKTINELAMQLKVSLKQSGIEDLNIQNSCPRRGDVARNYSDTTKAMKLLKWQSQVDFSEGLKETIDYFVAKN